MLINTLRVLFLAYGYGVFGYIILHAVGLVS